MCSFSGLIDDSETSKKLELAELQEVYEQLLNLRNTSHAEKNDLGLILDLIALCLQIDPLKRPTVKGLLSSPIFDMDQYELTQAERFSEHLFYYKNPELAISQKVTYLLSQICANIHIDYIDRVSQIIHYLSSCFFDMPGAYITARNMSKIVTLNSFSEDEKESMKLEALSSPSAELIKQAVNDKVFEMLTTLALSYYKKGEVIVLEQFLKLLTDMTFEMYSFASPIAPYVSILMESLIKLFIGEENYLESSEIKPNITNGSYVLRSTCWNSDLYYLIGPLYRDIISESGSAQSYYPVIVDYINSNRHPDYFSELLMLSENFALLKRQESSTTAKRNSIRHIRSMFQLGNVYKLKAALDFRLPQHILHCLQDSDFQVRYEAALIMLEISKGCKIREMPALEKEILATSIREEIKKDEIEGMTLRTTSKLNKKTTENKSLAQSAKPTVTFKSDTKSDSISKTQQPKKQTNKFEYTEEFLELEKIREEKVLEVKRELAKCFENPIFIAPIVRLVKLKSEPYDTKESAVKILFSILNGSIKCQDSALSPAMDTLSTLCKCLVISSRTADIKSGRMLAGILTALFNEFLENTRPKILKAISVTPGAEALLKEQGIQIPALNKDN